MILTRTFAVSVSVMLGAMLVANGCGTDGSSDPEPTLSSTSTPSPDAAAESEPDCSRDAGGDRLPALDLAFGDQIPLDWAVVESLTAVGEVKNDGDNRLDPYRSSSGHVLLMTAEDVKRADGETVLLGFRPDDGLVGLGLVLGEDGRVAPLNPCHDGSARLAEFLSDAEGDGAAEFAIAALADRASAALERVEFLRTPVDE